MTNFDTTLSETLHRVCIIVFINLDSHLEVPRTVSYYG
jgi:hypothetical protein